jgi:hypothetical protein
MTDLVHRRGAQEEVRPDEVLPEAERHHAVTARQVADA